jgi:hypothetical protein
MAIILSHPELAVDQSPASSYKVWLANLDKSDRIDKMDSTIRVDFGKMEDFLNAKERITN